MGHVPHVVPMYTHILQTLTRRDFKHTSQNACICTCTILTSQIFMHAFVHFKNSSQTCIQTCTTHISHGCMHAQCALFKINAYAHFRNNCQMCIQHVKHTFQTYLCLKWACMCTCLTHLRHTPRICLHALHVWANSHLPFTSSM